MQHHTREFQIFAKPAGPRCNLACSYCYYLEKENLYRGSDFKGMDPDLLREYIIQHIEATTDEVINFSWHGGEPTILGLDYFREIVRLQKKYKPGSKKINNGIQTNGVLIDEKWCGFLAAESFYVGLSIDGPADMHNSYRLTANRKPTHHLVSRGWDLICRFGISHEILCVVNSVNVNVPVILYNYFKKRKTSSITFLPLVELLADGSVSANSPAPESFGNFLIGIFDEWKANDIGKIRVQIFEEALRSAFGQDHTLCIFKKDCGGVPAVEHNGDFYSCDHFVNEKHLIGNISKRSISEMLDCEEQRSFGRIKSETLPGYCLDCEVLEMCNGECPKNRFALTPDGEPGLNWLCPGYKMFFNHCKPFVNAIAKLWTQKRR